MVPLVLEPGKGPILMIWKTPLLEVPNKQHVSHFYSGTPLLCKKLGILR